MERQRVHRQSRAQTTATCECADPRSPLHTTHDHIATQRPSPRHDPFRPAGGARTRSGAFAPTGVTSEFGVSQHGRYKHTDTSRPAHHTHTPHVATTTRTATQTRGHTSPETHTTEDPRRRRATNTTTYQTPVSQRAIHTTLNTSTTAHAPSAHDAHRKPDTRPHTDHDAHHSGSEIMRGDAHHRGSEATREGAPHEADRMDVLPRHTWEGNIYGARCKRCIDYVTSDTCSAERRKRGLLCEALGVPSNHKAIGGQVLFEHDWKEAERTKRDGPKPIAGPYDPDAKRHGGRKSPTSATLGHATTLYTRSRYESRRSSTSEAGGSR